MAASHSVARRSSSKPMLCRPCCWRSMLPKSWRGIRPQCSVSSGAKRPDSAARQPPDVLLYLRAEAGTLQRVHGRPAQRGFRLQARAHRPTEHVGEALQKVGRLQDPARYDDLGRSLSGQAQVGDESQPVVHRFGRGLEQVERGGVLVQSLHDAAEVLTPGRGAFGRPEGQGHEAFHRPRSRSQRAVERPIVGGQAEFAAAPCAQVARVADRPADDKAARVHPVAEQPQRRAGSVSLVHHAKGRARADVDRRPARPRRARAEIARRAVADRGPPARVGQGRKFPRRCPVQRHRFLT